MYVNKSFRNIVLCCFVCFGMCNFTTSVYATNSNDFIADEGYMGKGKEEPPADDVTPSSEGDQNDEALTPSGDSIEKTSVWEYIKILFSLIFVIGLLVVVLRFLNKRNMNYQQNRTVRNIGGISVGAQKSVQLVHIGDRIYIVGVGENVQLLKEIEDVKQVEELLTYYDEVQTAVIAPKWINLLRTKFSKGQQKQTEVKDFGQLFNKQLSTIKKERKDELNRWKEEEQEKK